MKKFEPLSKDFPHFLIGGDYNPEQWLDYPQILADDMNLMTHSSTGTQPKIAAWIGPLIGPAPAMEAN